MSTSLYWMPPPNERDEKCIGSIKWTIAKHLDPDWNGNGESWMVGKELIPFLMGIKAGNGSGDMGRDAESLIKAIEKFGQVELIIHS